MHRVANKIGLEKQLADKQARHINEREATKQFELALLQAAKDKDLHD